MYARHFVTGVLAGFQQAIEALIAGADDFVRSELEGLQSRIQETQTRIDPAPAAGNLDTAPQEIGDEQWPGAT